MDDKKKAQMEKIRQLAAAAAVEILAHYYQRDEVKKAADFVGGSGEIVTRAFESAATAVLICGPSYLMGEITQRGGLKKILIPRADLACPLSDAVTLDEVMAAKAAHPGALIVADIRAAQEIKAIADLVITPANAREKLAGTGGRQLIVLPGAQLADQAGFSGQVVGRWAKAICAVHELALPEDLAAAKELWPQAVVAVHSLSHPGIIAQADFAGDSSALYRFCAESAAREFIIVSESGLIEYLAETLPDKIFHETEAEIFCPNMKLTNLKSIITCLEDFQQNQKARA